MSQKQIHVFFAKWINLYVDGFKNMTIGKSLWAIIILKLIIMFAILKIFFFPNILSENYDSDDQRATAVRNILINRE